MIVGGGHRFRDAGKVFVVKLKPVGQQVVVVFGASSGIGRDAALRFAKSGAQVVVASNDAEGLRSVVQEIKQGGGKAVGVVADAADFAQVKAVADITARRFGRLDTWAHVAAVSIYATFEQTTPDEFARVIAVNLLGQMHGAQAALPYLKQNGGGALVMVSSVESMMALPYNSAYAASKHGVHGMIQAMRLELKHDKIPVSVTEIMPATIDTPLFGKAGTRLGVEPMAMPPIYPPQMVSKAIVYAASHPAREIVVGGAGKLLLLTQRVSPPLLDTFLLATAFEGQRSGRPKSGDAPNNLYVPLPHKDRVEGEEGAKLKQKVAGALIGQAAGQSNGSGANGKSGGVAKALPLAGALALAGAAIYAGQKRRV